MADPFGEPELAAPPDGDLVERVCVRVAALGHGDQTAFAQRAGVDRSVVSRLLSG
jgi:hypothetical protein